MRRTRMLLTIVAVGMFAVACGSQQTTDSTRTGLTGCGSDDSVVAAFLGGTEGGGLFPGDNPGAPTGSDVWVISAAGEYSQLTDGMNSQAPWLSPNGDALYFVRSSGEIAAGAPTGGVEGWRIDLESGEETLLVRGLSIDGLTASPDGQLIAYSSNAEDATDFVPTIKIAEVSAPDRSTSIIEGDAPAGHLTAQTAPAFSPDGTQLAYVSLISSPTYEQTTVVRLMDLETGAESLLYTAPDEGTLLGLEWLPDQSRLLAVRNHERARAVSIDPLTGRVEEIESDVTLTVEWASMDGTAISGIGVPPEDWELGPDEIDLLYMTWADGQRVDSDLPENLSFAHDLTIADCAYLN